MATKTKLPDRSEVLEEYTWKMTNISCINRLDMWSLNDIIIT